MGRELARKPEKTLAWVVGTGIALTVYVDIYKRTHKPRKDPIKEVRNYIEEIKNQGRK